MVHDAEHGTDVTLGVLLRRQSRISDVTRRARIPSTLLNLVQQVQEHVGSPDEVVTAVTFLVNTGRVVLTGNFAGHRIL